MNNETALKPKASRGIFPLSPALAETVAFWLLVFLIWVPLVQSPMYLLYVLERTAWIQYNVVSYAIGYTFYFAQVLCVLFALWYLLSWVYALVKGERSFSFAPGKLLREHPLGVLFTAFLVLGLVGTLRAENVARAIFGDKQRVDGYFAYLSYGAIILTASLVRERRKRMLLLKNFLIMMMLCGVLMLCQQFEAPVVSEIFWMKGAAFFRNSNHFGYIVAIAALAAAGFLLFGSEKKQRVRGGVLMALFLLVLFYNNTLGCHVAVLCAFLLAALLYKPSTGRWRLTALLPFAVYFALLVLTYLIPEGRFACAFVRENLLAASEDMKFLTGQLQDVGASSQVSQAAGRLVLWQHTLSIIAQKPLFGWGPEHIAQTFTQAGVLFSDSPHNEYLTMAAYFGIPAALCCYGGEIWLFIKRVRGVKAMRLTTMVALLGAFAYAVSAFFGVSMSHAASYYYLMLGLVAGGEAAQEAPVPCESAEQKLAA